MGRVSAIGGDDEIKKHEWCNDLTVLEGDVRQALKTLADESAQCVVTSPPYWGLRDYSTATWEGGDPNCDHGIRTWEGPKQTQGAQSGHTSKADKLSRKTCACGARRVDRQLGLEETPEEYVANIVTVCREVRRILRKDGTLWLNLGDSYNGSGGAGGDYGHGGLKEGQPKYPGRKVDGLKPKDLVGIPWMVAFALRADGWWLRSDIIWAKPNPMPESVTDRPTKAHEYIFLLTKSASYFYDADAIREPHADMSVKRWGDGGEDTDKTKFNMRNGSNPLHAAGRNKRTVWTVATQPYAEAHFATYPTKLIEPCILAGTSPQACPMCGSPWWRMTERASIPGGAKRDFANRGDDKRGRKTGGANGCGFVSINTTGWAPTCSCEANDGSGKCVVLDPFGGSMTTAEVALSLGRQAIMCELNPAYVEIGKRRILGTQTRLSL